jgi:putative membrane protein
MVNYDPKHWWRGILAYHGTVTPQVLGRVAILCGITAAIYVAEFSFTLRPLNPLGHTLMGVVLGLLLVFRTNSSYDRFWEGRKLWGGLVNASRNLVRGAAAYTPSAGHLASLVSAYVVAVKENLRGNRDLAMLSDRMAPEMLKQVADVANPPSAIAFHISSWIHRRHAEGNLAPDMMRVLEGHLSTMVDCQGGCERILRTPIPFVYAVHLRHLMVAYLVTLPFVLIPIMDWCAILAVGFVSFSLLGIEEAGLEIEDPFGEDPNDLPLDDICGVISRDANMIAGLGKMEE